MSDSEIPSAFRGKFIVLFTLTKRRLQWSLFYPTHEMLNLDPLVMGTAIVEATNQFDRERVQRRPPETIQRVDGPVEYLDRIEIDFEARAIETSVKEGAMKRVLAEVVASFMEKSDKVEAEKSKTLN